MQYQNPWDTFAKTGNIKDYLDYKNWQSALVSMNLTQMVGDNEYKDQSGSSENQSHWQ